MGATAGTRFRYQVLEPVGGLEGGTIVESVDVPDGARPCQVAQLRGPVWVALPCDCGGCEPQNRRQQTLNAVNGVRGRR